MATAEEATDADRYHVVCDDDAFWQWHGAVDETEARRQADQLAADLRAGYTTIWIVPCAGSVCAVCWAPNRNTPHEDDTFAALTAAHEPYWRR